METTACTVQHQKQMPDVVDGLLPPPTSIKEQMPKLAAMLQNLSGQLGRDSVQRLVRASMDLRKAYDADDYKAVSSVYARGHGWTNWEEGGYSLGVPNAAMQAFAKKHRGK